MLEQGRQYTTWLYGNQYDKLWDRFSPEMRQTFGSVTELASFAGPRRQPPGPRAGRRGRARRARGAVPRVQPDRVVRQRAPTDAHRVEPGRGRRGHRPACSGPDDRTYRSVDPAAERHLALHRQEHDLAGLIRQAEHQHLRPEPRDVPVAQVHRRDHQPADQLLGRYSARSWALEVFSPSGPKSIHSL